MLQQVPRQRRHHQFLRTEPCPQTTFPPNRCRILCRCRSSLSLTGDATGMRLPTLDLKSSSCRLVRRFQPKNSRSIPPPPRPGHRRLSAIPIKMLKKIIRTFTSKPRRKKMKRPRLERVCWQCCMVEHLLINRTIVMMSVLPPELRVL